MLRNLITDEGKYYLYRHIRLDKNEPFYIGRGTKTNLKAPYKRAYSKHRHQFWHNITNKSNYNVEILVESDNLEFIKQKEIEFTKLYGRKVNNTGSLVNILEGDKFNYTSEGYNKLVKTKIESALAKYCGYIKIPILNCFIINKNGTIISTIKDKIITPIKTKEGLLIVNLAENYKKFSYSVGYLVATTFIDNPKNKTNIIYLDGNKNNNNVTNLVWATLQEKTEYDLKLNLVNTGKSRRCNKLTNLDAFEICYIKNNFFISITELAELYNISPMTISKILNNKTKYFKNNYKQTNYSHRIFNKLSPSDIFEILTINKSKLTSKSALAKLYNIDRQTINTLANNPKKYVSMYI